MNDLNNCRNCKYWESGDQDDNGMASCQRVDAWKKPNMISLKLEVSDDTGLEADVVTHGDFGCNQHEEKS